MSGDAAEVVRLSSDVAVRRADNPGPMTLEGTNSYLLGVPGGPVAVVDPGPLEPAAAMERHRAALRSAGPVETVLLTHRHLDHAESASVFAASGCPVRAADPAWRLGGGAGLDDGAVLRFGATVVTVIAAPGHTADSVVLLVRGVDTAIWLLTGDTVLGRGTSVIAAPDGDLGAYLHTLRRLLAVVRESAATALLPGHGPVVTDPAGVLTAYLEHREQRLDLVRQARQAGAMTAAAVVAQVYADVDRSLWGAAEQSVQAQLDYLDRG